MQSTIFFMLAIVAFTKAKQLNYGPQTFSESSPSSKVSDKRYATQEITLFLTPTQIKSLNEARNSANNEAETQSLKESEQYTLQGYGQQPELNEWPKYTGVGSIEQPQEEIQDLTSQNPYFIKNKPVFENQEESYDPYNFYREQNLKEQQTRNIEQGSDRKEAQFFKPNNPISNKAQEEALLHDELQQHWNRILEHNRNQLKALSAANEKQNTEDLKVNKESTARWESNYKEDEEIRSKIDKEIQFALAKNQKYNFGQENGDQLKALPVANEKQNTEYLKAIKESTGQWKANSNEDEESRSEIEKEIQFALRNNQKYAFGQGNSRAEEQANNQRLPILIHKEVRVTKHLPVHVVQKVKVSVPTPVLVPVPEPYEVKVPHPYPVPYEIIKHIPVPVIRKH